MPVTLDTVTGRPRATRRAWRLVAALVLLAVIGAAAGCGDDEAAGDEGLRVVTSAGFLADLAANVAGDRAVVTSLIPPDTSPHGFQPTPSDLRAVAGADLVVLNGAGLEAGLADALREVAGDTPVVESAAGLPPRTPQPGEPAHQHEHEGEGEHEGEHEHEDEGGSEHEGEGDHEHEGEVDPHFWLDPKLAVRYVENIRDALTRADPAGAEAYETNASAYIEELRALDRWIAGQIATIPPADRLLVMNHVSHGYFADRYGLRIVGAVIPSVSSGDAPSARDLAELTATIRAAGVKAIFVDSGENPKLSRQIARETGVLVVDDLRTHALSEEGGGAETYVDMLRHDTTRIVEALR
jgi:ABC-type Zn uptake system ZnuABC Zn-binding protein ZnuA